MAKQDTLVEDDDVKTEDLVIVETQDSDERPARKDEDSDIDPDNPDGDASSDPEREAIRERRRLEKIERKKRREDAMGRDKTERDFLLKRNDELERRLSQIEARSHTQDLGNIDSQIAAAQNEAQMAERIIAKAVDAGNGEDVAKAMRYRDEAIAKANQLAWSRQQAAKPTPVQNGLDPSVARHAQEFMKDNPWYDMHGRDESSAIILAIDQSLARENFDPRTEDYWDELRDRAAKRLPEKFGKPAPAPERQVRGGPATGSGREHAPESTRKEVYISPERKKALIDAGVWDDPVLRQKYVKRYAEYDKTNRA